MSQFDIRQPARLDLGTKSLESGFVSDEVSRRLEEACGERGRITKINGEVIELEGFYQLDNGSKKLFLKVIPAHYIEQQEEANKFASFVRGFGVHTSTIISGYPVHLDEGFAVFAYDWIEGRCIDSNQDELRQLGYQLGELHQAFHKYPDIKSVSNLTEKRLRALRNIVEKILNTGKGNTHYSKRLYELLEKSPHVFESFSEPCQVLHGDLNVGNLLLNGEDITFLDFEDSKHSWFPLRIEMAFVLERFVLINELDDQKALVNARALLAAYLSSARVFPFKKPGEFKSSLEWLSLRSLCMLQQFEWDGASWPESEWIKFYKLVDQIESRSELLYEIEASVL